MLLFQNPAVYVPDVLVSIRIFSDFSILGAGFAAELGQIRKNRTFSNLQGLNLCTSHILVVGCLHGQDVVGS